MTSPGDREYLPSLSVPDTQAYFAAYRTMSAAARSRYVCETLAYGPTPAERLDLFVASSGAPLVVFLHGGYWRSFSKDDFSFVVDGFAPRGYSVAIVDYGLAPAVPLAEIVAQCRRSVAYLRALPAVDPQHVVVSGHSAGGHLAAMCAVTTPLTGVATISGLHDLEPLLATSVNDWLRLDASHARALSPVHLAPAAPLALYAAVGAEESASFHDQMRRLVTAWGERGARVRAEAIAGTHHFSVIAQLADPESPLSTRIAEMLPVAGAR